MCRDVIASRRGVCRSMAMQWKEFWRVLSKRQGSGLAGVRLWFERVHAQARTSSREGVHSTLLELPLQLFLDCFAVGPWWWCGWFGSSGSAFGAFGGTHQFEKLGLSGTIRVAVERAFCPHCCGTA